MKKRTLFLLIIVTFVSIKFTLAQKNYADLILWGGKIITVDVNNPFAQAVAVKDSMIMAVGSNAEMMAFLGPDTDTIKLNGYTVTPGMIDAHLHLMYYGQSENDFVNLRSATTIEQVVDAIEQEVQNTPAGEWVIGDGFFKLDDMIIPTKWDLDPISPNNPVFLNSLGGHYGSANSMALDIAGVTDTTQSPVGGFIEKDSITGEPNGRLWNHPAMDVVRVHFPAFDSDALAADVLFAQELCLVNGITSYQDVNVRGHVRVVGYYKALDSLKVRGVMLYTIEKSHDATISADSLGSIQGPMLTLGGDKFLVDGQVPTSYTYEPHPGPSWDVSTWDEDTLAMCVKKLHRAGHQMAFHCMGDRAIDLVLDVIEAAQNDTFRIDHRHRLEHCMIPTDSALDRIKDMGMVVSVQPSVIYSSAQFYYGFWGPERVERFMPMRTMIDKGIPVAIGTDYPTTPYIEPNISLWSACLRKSELGFVLGEHERVNIQEALYAQTMGSAYAAFEENVKGSIEVGKYADMVIWSDDMYTIPLNQLKNLYVIKTIVGGTVHNNPNLGIDHSHDATQPSGFRLFQNYPNPVTATTQITFEIPYRSHVQINILNTNGQVIQKVMDMSLLTGKHSIIYDAGSLTNGTWFIQMKTERFTEIKKMIVLK